MQKLAPVAEDDFRLDWQLPEQLGPEFCASSRFPDDKRARRTDIHHTVGAQLGGENAWAERPVPADVDTPQEHNESHGGIIRKALGIRPARGTQCAA